MRKMKKLAQFAWLILIPLLLSGCFTVRVIRNVKNPDRYFSSAYKRIDYIHQKRPNREGRADSIQVLVYEASERQLVKVSAPFWLVNTCMDIGIKAADEEEEGFEFDERYDFDWRDIKDLEKLGPGLLVEIEDEESKVLIWLD
jgi:hypothetical protein